MELDRRFVPLLSYDHRDIRVGENSWREVWGIAPFLRSLYRDPYPQLTNSINWHSDGQDLISADVLCVCMYVCLEQV